MVQGSSEVHLAGPGSRSCIQPGDSGQVTRRVKSVTKSGASEEGYCRRHGVIQGSSEVHLAGPGSRSCIQPGDSGQVTGPGSGPWGPDSP